jgi:hypothetical protein
MKSVNLTEIKQDQIKGNFFKQNSNIIQLEKLETVKEGPLMLSQESIDEEDDKCIRNQLFHIGSPKVISTFAISSDSESTSHKYQANFITKRSSPMKNQ